MTKQNIILVDDQQHAAILAALRFYQAQGLGEPANRPVAIHDIATNGDTVISLDGEGIDALCERLQTEPEPKMATEDEIADYLAMQLADGHISPSDLAARMAKYGMRDPREFAIEMRERIDELRAA